MVHIRAWLRISPSTKINIRSNFRGISVCCSAAVTTKESWRKTNRTKMEIVELHTTIQIKICTALLNSKSQNRLTNKLEILNKSQSNKIDTWCSQKIHMTYMVQDDDLKKIKQNAVPEKWIFSTDRTS